VETRINCSSELTLIILESEDLDTEFMAPEKGLAGTHKNRPSEHAQSRLRREVGSVRFI
jgi:hypothetical protein